MYESIRHHAINAEINKSVDALKRSAGKVVDIRTRERMRDEPALSYAQAMRAVLAEDRRLAAQYANGKQEPEPAGLNTRPPPIDPRTERRRQAGEILDERIRARMKAAGIADYAHAMRQELSENPVLRQAYLFGVPA